MPPSWEQTDVYATKVDAENGTQTRANMDSYYEAYKKEQYASTPVNKATFFAIVESYLRNSGLPGAV